MFYSLKDVQATVERTERNRATLEKLKLDFEELMQAPITFLSYDKFMEFQKSGNRKIFENLYFERRKRLAKCAVLSMVYDDEKYIKALEEIIWAICNEYTWCIPAHLWRTNNPYEVSTNVDLFAAETGQALSEIDSILADRLSDTIRERIAYEVRRRIINSFAEKGYHWERIKNNWAAVCAGSVAMTYMYQAEKEEFEREYPRFESAMKYFLSSYGEDGACCEGGGYWNYGFGYFVYYAEMLRRYTNGGINLFADEKINKIAKFQQIMYLTPHRTANFSDCGSGFSYRGGLTSFLAKEYSDVKIPPIESLAAFDGDHCYRWAPILRDIIWSDSAESKAETNKYYFLPDAQWYIRTKDKYAFAAKGGHNDEPHNHNDAGSYIIIVDEKAVSDELGMGEYTREYFGEGRYKLYPNRSMGHSVPIIDGTEQQAGKEFASTIIKQTKDEFVVDIAKAYPIPELESFTRSFLLKDDEIILTDEFEGNVQNVTERIITREKPVVDGKNVRIGNCIIECDADFEISEDSYSGHGAMQIEIYFIDYKFNGKKLTIKYKCDN